MVTQGELMPNVGTVDFQGKTQNLWDYRQKSHAVLIHEPDAVPETRHAWREGVRRDSRTWAWLGVQFVFPADPAPALAPGAYAVDRYGTLIRFHPAGQWTLKEIEQDFLYYEARHC
jgi:hypothetical protein